MNDEIPEDVAKAIKDAAKPTPKQTAEMDQEGKRIAEKAAKEHKGKKG